MGNVTGHDIPKVKLSRKREAARKAWDTIRKKRVLEKQQSSKSLLKLDVFITPNQTILPENKGKKGP